MGSEGDPKENPPQLVFLKDNPLNPTIMNNYCTLSDAELLGIFNNALNAEAIEEKEARRRAKARKAKADFFNLDATDYCKFVSE